MDKQMQTQTDRCSTDFNELFFHETSLLQRVYVVLISSMSLTQDVYVLVCRIRKSCGVAGRRDQQIDSCS